MSIPNDQARARSPREVALSLFDDFENFSTFAPRDIHRQGLGTVLDQLVGWGWALKRYRDEQQLQRKAA